jgi:outer membrane protein W
MKKAIIIVTLAVIVGSASFAQNVWTVNYDIGIPLGSMTDYVSKASFRGFSVNGNTYITDKITVGGTIHWSAYYEKYPRDTYELPDGAITSTVWAKAYTMPLLVNVRYNFKPEGTIRPYVGLATGAYYIQQETQIGLFTDKRDNWRWGLTPEVGLYYPFGLSDFGLHARVGYNHVFYNVDPIGTTLSNLTISVGVSLFSW